MSAPTQRAGYMPGARMAWRQGEVQRIGEELATAIRRVSDLSHELMQAMPTWGDLTATEGIALGERCIAWAIVERHAERALHVRRDCHHLLAHAMWAQRAWLFIPTRWSIEDSEALFANPDSFDLTRDEVEYARAARLEAFMRRDALAREMAATDQTNGTTTTTTTEES